jgi:hypothetical protein
MEGLYRWRLGVGLCAALAFAGFVLEFLGLALLATVRGGTSFLFPTAKKKRSKENAYRR